MNKSFLSVSSIVVLFGILVVLNALASNLFSGAYVDLTEGKLYSLSSGSKNILNSLEDKIKLRYYFSKTDAGRYPALKLYGTRVLDFLREYERAGGGNIELEVYDPRPDSEEEEWAQKYGLQAVQLPAGDKVFIGLAAINGIGEEASIPFFNITRQEFLEYDITKLIYSLTRLKRPKVAFISSINIKGQEVNPMAQLQGAQPEEQPWFMVQQIKELYDVQFLEGAVTSIEDDIDVLILVHPKNLADTTLFAIDQFVVKGGNLLVLTDPFLQADAPPPAMQQNPMEMMMMNPTMKLMTVVSRMTTAKTKTSSQTVHRRLENLLLVKGEEKN